MKKFVILLSALSILLLILAMPGLQVFGSAPAQVESDWSEPLNLSRSGSASDPHNVVDAWGRIHVVWQDDFAGLVYTQGAPETFTQAGGWSAPAALSLPFEEALATLVMVADSQGLVHAAWLDEEGNLFYSRVPGQSFDNPGAWSSPLLMAVSAADFAMTAAPDGKVHLAFLRNTATSDFPAGIYTRFNYGSSDIWSLPTLVYTSSYLRGLDTNQAQLSLAATVDGGVYLAWDETPQEKIYLAVSKDGGSIWGNAVELDRRQPGDGGSSGPSQPVVLTTPGSILLTWQAGHQGSNCAHYYRQSSDGGGTWNEPGLLPEPFAQSCAQRLQVIQKEGTETWLALTNPTGLYLLAYDPTRASEPWSPPRLQQALSGFTHPETYRAVSLACRDVAMAGEQLIVSACEVDKNGDIWFLQRTLGESTTWYPTPAPPPFWSEPALLAASPEIVDAPVMTGDPQGRLHAFWTQANDSSLYHALWDGESWSAASALFRSPGGEPGKLTTAVHPSGQLFLVWSDAAVGTLYYSQAPYGQAVTPAAWSAPLPLPLMLADSQSARAVVDPQLEIGADGMLYLAFAVPFNENRGIYVQRSLQGDLPIDPGQEIGWSEAETVLDAESAGWDSLGEPRLAILLDGRLELLWTRYSLPPAQKALGLYAAFSPNADAIDVTGWSEPVEIVHGELLWSQLLATGDGRLHRAWQQLSSGQEVLLHQVSTDDGETWSESSRITGTENTSGPVEMAVAADPTRLQMVQIVLAPVMDGAEGVRYQLRRWTWEAEAGWTRQESQPIPNLLQTGAIGLGTAGDPAGGTRLGVVYSGVQAPLSASELETEAVLSGLFAQNAVDSTALTAPVPADVKTPTPTEAGGADGAGADGANASEPGGASEPGETPEMTGEIAPTESAAQASVSTPTPAFQRQAPGLVQRTLNQASSPLLAGLVPAIVLVLVISLLINRHKVEAITRQRGKK